MLRSAVFNGTLAKAGPEKNKTTAHPLSNIFVYKSWRILLPGLLLLAFVRPATLSVKEADCIWNPLKLKSLSIRGWQDG